MIAAALAGEASIVVSNDKRLRAETESADLGLLAMSADDFATHLWTLAPDDVDEVINTLVAKRTKQPVTAHDLIEAMRGSVPTMTAAWLAGNS